MFEAILFDFDGTLVDYVNSDIESLRWLHTCVDAPVCFEDFLETAVAEIMHFHQLVDNDLIDPLLMHEFRLKNTFAQYKMAWNDNLVNLYRQQLIKTCLPLMGVEALLETLQPRIKLGLVTNAYDGAEQRARIRNSGLEKFFDCIVIAGEIGIYKPDPTIFLHALDHIHAVPNHSLFVGDSVKHDVFGAKSAGLKTMLFSQKHLEEADYTVKSISAMAKLLPLLI